MEAGACTSMATRVRTRRANTRVSAAVRERERKKKRDSILYTGEGEERKQANGRFCEQENQFIGGYISRGAMTYLRNPRQPTKEKNPPQASNQSLWPGTNHTCSIKHESSPRRKRQDTQKQRK